jgi:hypothetical protein
MTWIIDTIQVFNQEPTPTKTLQHSPYRTIANNTLFLDDQVEEAMAANRKRGGKYYECNLMEPNQPYLDESPFADLEVKRTYH